MKNALKIVMLPTPLKREGQIIKAIKGSTPLTAEGKLALCGFPTIEDGIKWQHNELYVLSDENPITQGWYVNLDIPRVLKCTDGSPYDGHCMQIIATTNPVCNLPMIEESFVRSYIKSYNLGNTIREVQQSVYYSEIITY